MKTQKKISRVMAVMAIGVALSIQTIYAGVGGMRLIGGGGGGAGGVSSGGHSGGFRAMSFMSRSMAPVASNHVAATPSNRIGNTASANGPVFANMGSGPISGIPSANTGPVFPTTSSRVFATTGTSAFATSTGANATGNFFPNLLGNMSFGGSIISDSTTGGFRASGPIPGAPIPGPTSPSAENSGAVATPPSGNYPGTGSGIQTGVVPAPFAPSGPTPGSGNTGVGRTPPSGVTPGTGASQ